MLTETGKAAVIHPTGTGKSFIGLTLCEDNPDKTVCWLSPSAYIFQTQLENLKKAADGYAPENICFFTYAKLIGMAGELFDGNVASEMTLGEAIVQGILNSPKYVLSVYSYQMASHNGEYIVFFASGEHMKEMMERVPEWFSKIDPEPHVYSAYSNDPETSQAFAAFKADTSDHLKLLFCIDMLNEGIHVEDIDGVILLPPTVSPILCKHQIGRALSATKSKHAVTFDIVNNIENIYSIGAIEEEMQKDCRELFDRMNDTFSASRNIMYGYAKANYKEFGTQEISSRYRTKDGYFLGSWVFNQRSIRKGQMKGFLTDEQVRMLDEIGMVWDSVADLNWDRNYHTAVEYCRANGNLEVPAKYVSPEGVRLGTWLAKQRNTYQINNLTQQQVDALEAVGIVWNL